MPWPGALPESLKVYVRKENIRGLKVVQTRGLGGMLPYKMFKFRVSEMDIIFLAKKNTRQSAVFSCLFYLSLISCAISG